MKLCSLQTSKQYTMPNFECMHFLLCTLFSQSEFKKDQQRGIQKVLQKLLILFLVFVCVSCRQNLQYTTKTTKSCNLFEVQQQNHKLSIVNLFVCVSLSQDNIVVDFNAQTTYFIEFSKCKKQNFESSQTRAYTQNKS